ncbi:DDE-type integrase/transposase/recombinase [Streptomyces yunnanensis]|uniref:DDE-type integrase/transposase/recombinase n=1 Tax=Streptomyces yunnanensis TaxID=156453 RepID=UPI003B832169
MDEAFVRISGKLHCLGRVAGQDGNVLGVLVTAKRDARAAQWFFRRLLRDLQYVPRVAVADKLRSSIPVRLLRYLTPLPAPPPPAHRPRLPTSNERRSTPWTQAAGRTPATA